MSTKPRITINEKDGSVTVRIRKARLSFPALWTPRAFEEGGKAAYQATFLMPAADDENENVKFLKLAVAEVVKRGLKGKHPGKDKVCLRSGEEKGERGIEGYNAETVFCSSSSQRPVSVVDRNLDPLTEKDGRPYAGCYVNATVRLWAQDNKYGKRVNAQLRAIQFAAEGEPFGESAADPTEEFDAEEGDDML